MNTIEVQNKLDKLEEVRTELKKEFVGIDYVIDSIIDGSKAWYVFPELVTTVHIICLWGMTGTGKTSLVSSFAEKLGFSSKFAKIDLSDTYHSLRAALQDQDISTEEQSIIFFDEIQKANSKDEEGKLKPYKHQEFWELLSTGQIKVTNIFGLLDDLVDYQNYQNDAELKDKRLYGFGLRTVASLTGKSLRSLIEEGSAKTYKEASEMVLSHGTPKLVKDYRKSLIVIAGNLDSVFTGADDSSEADIDADYFAKQTEKITLVDIKMALEKKFTPEQIARFGNRHIIYKAFTKKEYEKIIELNLNRFNKCLRDNNAGIQVVFTKSLCDFIYRNSVFPTQGVRPLLSSISSFVSTKLTDLLFKAKLEGITSITVDYHYNHLLVPELGYSDLYIGDLDKIKNNASDNEIAITTVHECGHALVYTLLFNTVPKQLVTKTTSSYIKGFVFPNETLSSKESILLKIQVAFGGICAEKIVFGPANVSSGHSSDMWSATRYAIDYVRRLGFSVFKGYYQKPDSNNILDPLPTDDYVEELLNKLEEKTNNLILDNKELLDTLIRESYNKNLSDVDLVRIFRSAGREVALPSEKEESCVNYSMLLDSYLKNDSEFSTEYQRELNTAY